MMTTLIEAATRSAGLALFVWFGLKVLRVRCPQTRSVVWTAVLLSALCMPLLMRLTDRVITAAPAAAVRWIPLTPVPLEIHPVVFTPAIPPPSTVNWWSMAAGFYVLVACILGMRLLTGAWRAAGLVRNAVRIKQRWVPGGDVRCSNAITIPVTCGSTILLPGDFTRWNSFKQRAVLLHEHTHVQRRDYYFHLLAGLHRTIFWFSPVAWWLQSELVKLAELIADDASVQKLGDPLAYADVLLETAEKGSRFGFVAPGMAGGNNMEHRIDRLLDESKAGPVSRTRGLLAATLVLPLAAISASAWAGRAESAPLKTIGPLAPITQQQATRSIAVPPVVQPSAIQEAVPATPAPVATARVAVPSQAPAQQAPPPPSPTPEPAFLEKFLEEITLIAEPAERNAYSRLKTDEEFEAFLNLFWRRRDPTPGTAENEYQSEFYRRVGLANQQFGTAAGTPGWRTDRGMILIRFGDPDEVQKSSGGTYYRPAEEGGGTVSTPPFEKWRYRRVEGYGNNVELEFVDSARTGDYWLVSEKDRILRLLGIAR